MLAFLGPSASGKSSVVRELARRGVIAVTPSWTTRPRRPNESDNAIEHRFVTEAEFDELERHGWFLEVVTLFGLPFRYGLPPVVDPPDGRVPAIMVRAPLMDLVARHFPNHVAYQIESDTEQAHRRLLAREVDESTIEGRLRGYEEERLLGRKAAARVFVNATTVDELATAVQEAIQHDFGQGAGRGENECPETV